MKNSPYNLIVLDANEYSGIVFSLFDCSQAFDGVYIYVETSPMPSENAQRNLEIWVRHSMHSLKHRIICLPLSTNTVSQVARVLQSSIIAQNANMSTLVKFERHEYCRSILTFPKASQYYMTYFIYVDIYLPPSKDGRKNIEVWIHKVSENTEYFIHQFSMPFCSFLNGKIDGLIGMLQNSAIFQEKVADFLRLYQ